jgi:hypothetical protein
VAVPPGRNESEQEHANVKIAFIGYGQVGAPLADHLQRLGHEVTLAAKAPGSASTTKALARNTKLRVASPQAAVAAADVVFLATPFQANAAALGAVADELRCVLPGLRRQTTDDVLR